MSETSSKIGTITITGASGQKYEFNVHPYGTSFKKLGAVYYISERTENPDGTGNHTKIYIGQTEDLSERFDNHHKERCFLQHNANAISIHRDNNEKSRLAKEADLITGQHPPCNG